MMKSLILIVGAAIVVALLPCNCDIAAAAPAKTIELRLAHGQPGMHPLHTKVWVPWAAELEKRTQGRVKVKIYPANQLGAPPEHYDIAVRGTCDISAVTPTQIPGRFPLEVCFHLPYLVQGAMGDPTSDKLRHMIYEKYLIPYEFKDVKVLWTGRYGLNVLHMVKKPVRTVEDMQGLVIGFPGGRIMPKLMARVNASAEMTFVPDMYTSLERGTIDGMIIPMEATAAFKLQEVEKYNTRLDLASGSFFMAMNLKTWKSLSPDIQKIIEELNPWAEEATAKALDEATKVNYMIAEKAGVELIEFTPEDMARFVKISRPVEVEWVEEMAAKGLPTRALYDDIKKLVGR